MVPSIKNIVNSIWDAICQALMHDQVQHLLGSIPTALILFLIWSSMGPWLAGGFTLLIIQVLKEHREGAAKSWYGKSVNDKGNKLPPTFGVKAELYGLRRVLGIGEDPERRDTFLDAWLVGGVQVGIGGLLQWSVGG